MAAKVPARIAWAVELLAIDPNDQILEIGCGPGVAISLICERLEGGKVTAIDRSPIMIGRAAKRNAACIDAGKAELHPIALADAEFGGVRFDKIFAVSVNVFWLQPRKELAAVRRLLAEQGRLYLFYQPFAPNGAQEVIAKVQKNLVENGFAVADVHTAALGADTGVCIIAKPTGE
jgi:SAM-dependent methyltransferase